MQPAISPDLQPLRVFDRPPLIRAASEADLPRARRAVERLDPARLGAGRSVAAAEVAYLAASAPGRRFLEASPPRALARGEPAQTCPATGLARAGDAPGAEPGGRGSVAGRALAACRAALPGDGQGCACRLIALDRLVLIPLSEAGHAPGVAARLEIPALDLARVLVAEETPAGGIDLHGLERRAGRVERLGAGRVRVRLAGLPPFEGRARPVGIRRGRIAERIVARDAAGRRLTLSVGLGPAAPPG